MMFSILLIINIAVCLILVLKIYRTIDFLLCITLSLCIFFASFVTVSGILFLYDSFSLPASLWSCLATEGASLGALSLLCKSELGVVTCKPRTYLLPLLIITTAILLCRNSFEYFGMGQDQGVYQTKALELLNNHNKNWREIEEYNKLNASDQEGYLSALNSSLGFYIYDPSLCYPTIIKNFFTPRNMGGELAGAESQMFQASGISQRIQDRSSVVLAGNYHGIPTYAALLALWGKVFGIASMAQIQMIFLLCVLCMMFFIFHNFNFSPLISTILFITFGFSPIVIWLTKSTLCEMFLALLVCWFLFHLTDNEHPDKKYLAALPVCTYSFFHVTIYTLMPFFLLSFLILYLWEQKKQYILAANAEAFIFTIGYTAMFCISPLYTFYNSRQLMLNKASLFFAPVLLCIVILSSIRLLKHRAPFSAIELCNKTNTARAVRFIILFSITAILITAYRISSGVLPQPKVFQTYYGSSILSVLPFLTLSAFTYTTGFFFIPLILFYWLKEPKSLFKNSNISLISFAFFYCILMMSSFLRKEIPYYYYYARYLVPFLPIIIIEAGVIMNDHRALRSFAPALCALSLLCYAPYDHLLIKELDISHVEWSTLRSLAKTLNKTPNSALLINGQNNDLYRCYFHALRALTSADVYPVILGKKVSPREQLQELSSRYDHVYLLSLSKFDLNPFGPFELELALQNQASIYDAVPAKQVQIPKRLIPFPVTSHKTITKLYLYQYNAVKLGQTLSFNDGSNGINFLQAGWSSPEPWGVWGTGQEHTIQLKFEDIIQQDLSIIFYAHSFFTDKNVKILVNGNKIAILTVKSDKKRLYTVKIPKEIVEGKDFIHICFNIIDPVFSPQDVKISEDSRQLGLALTTLLIQ